MARLHLDPQGQDGMAVGRHHVRIGATHRAEQQLVAHGAPVDDEVHMGRGAAMEGREPGEARQRHALARDADRNRVVVEFGAEHLRETAQEAELARRLGRISDR